MGSWFSNLHIKKGENANVDGLTRFISQWMADKQFLPAASAKEANVSFAILPAEDSNWISVYSDMFSFDNPEEFSTLAFPLSQTLGTDVLGVSCFDSDYVYLNLIDAAGGIDAWAGAGLNAYLEKKRRSNFSAWKKKVTDYPLFKASMQEQRVFAEEVLRDIVPCLALPESYSAACYETLPDMGFQENALYLHFKLPDDLKSKDPPILFTYATSYTYDFWDQPLNFSCLNKGGASKGISIFFLGSYVEHDEVAFSKVCFVKRKKDLSGVTHVPIKLEKIQLPNGEWAYRYHDPNFKIPPKLNDCLPPKKLYDAECANKITVLFTPHGDSRKIPDITVVMIPDQNPEGRCSWNVLDSYDSIYLK